MMQLVSQESCPLLQNTAVSITFKKSKKRDKMHAVHAVYMYGCTYPISDILFRNLARAAAGRPLDVHDGVLGRSGNKWEAHSGSTRPGEFCDFDGTQGRAMRALFADYSNELM
jgi:hypothetical protein